MSPYAAISISMCTECHPCMSQHSISIRTFTLLQEVTWAGATAIADFCLSPSLYRLAYCMCVVHASESARVHALSQWTLTRCEFTQCTVHGKDALLRNHGFAPAKRSSRWRRKHAQCKPRQQHQDHCDASEKMVLVNTPREMTALFRLLAVAVNTF